VLDITVSTAVILDMSTDRAMLQVLNLAYQCLLCLILVVITRTS
jgi:hypothetical protein